MENRDPYLTCIVCGMETSSWTPNKIDKERPDWRKMREQNPHQPVIIPASDLEAVDFIGEELATLWAAFYRAIIDDPTTNSLFISGINRKGDCTCPGPVINDPDKACVFFMPRRRGRAQSRFTDFHPVNMSGYDKNRAAGKRIGYAIHAACWLLLDRVIGADLVTNNLRAFVDTVSAFWKKPANRCSWETESIWEVGPPEQDPQCWYEPDSVGLRKIEEVGELDEDGYPREFTKRDIHAPNNPFRIVDIAELVGRVALPKQGEGVDGSFQPNGTSSAIAAICCLPTDIALLIVDTIYTTREFCRARVQDTRNLLRATGWVLPRSYWVARCNPAVVFEVQDLLDSGKAADWAALCLGLEELQLHPDWYCNSGLNHRRKILGFLAEIKEGFAERLLP
ncbi:uncharacterized protein DSM5745_07204 [Aspergillus mulundensis]|uniref:Uncharacterized protein n=1 Tax=Aspergillus mulundensis TaxID=1810919 RepID=A0A3D8RKF7_9EURO|nr:hypothetical protein DSM5745_07204 [Aspergillus mulundensis]RDW74542.1 hypothetical protein DSM5745_07204 [Aspergillus mulundensis]